MSDRSQIWYQLTLLDLVSATSSPASPVGVLPVDSPACPTKLISGPDPVRAKDSRRQEDGAASTIPAISGPPGSSSSASAALQLSLASRLRADLAGRGSILYSLTWKEQVTPAQRRICRLAASALRTVDSGCSSWPTPTVSTGDYQYDRTGADGERAKLLKLSGVAKLSTWPTPRAVDGAKGPTADKPERTEGEDLPTAAGRTASGSHAPTASRGQLNPEHTRWCMGYPDVWRCCGATAMQSSRKSRRRSSVPG